MPARRPHPLASFAWQHPAALIILITVMTGMVVAGIAATANAAAPRIGVAAAVNPQAVKISPGTQDQALFIGANVVHDERIRTGNEGRTQVVFLDGSALTIGPNADMIIDEFVYDPAAKAGTLALTAAKGAFRFVGGRISKKKPVIINTPTAVIGIRGGIAMFDVGASTTATFLFGEEMQVTAGNVTRTVDTPGFSVDVPAGADVPSSPKRAAPTSLKAAVIGLEATPQSNTGVDKPPVDQDVAGTQLATLSSNRTPRELDQGPSNANKEGAAAGGQQQDKNEGPDDKNSAPANRLANSGPNRSFQSPVLPTTVSLPDAIRALPEAQRQEQMTQAGTAAASVTYPGRFKSSALATATFGTLDLDSNRNITFVNGTLANGFFSAELNGQTVRLPAGSPGTTANFFEGGGTLGNGRVSGSSHFSPDGTFVTFDLRLTDLNNARATAFAGKPLPAGKLPTAGHTNFALTSDFVLASNIAFLPEAEGGSIAPLPGTVSTDHGAIVWDVSGSANAQRAMGLLQSYVSGTGSSQRSVIGLTTGQVLLDPSGRPYISGHTRGGSRLSDGTSYFFEGNVTSTPAGDGTHFFGTGESLNFGLQSASANANGVTTPSATKVKSGSSTKSYFSNVYASNVVDNDASQSRTSEVLQGFAVGAGQSYDSSGNLTGIGVLKTTNANPSGVSIVTDKDTNKLSASLGLSSVSASQYAVLSFGDNGSESGRSAYIDSKSFGAVESSALSTHNGTSVSNHRSYLFSSTSIDSTGLLPAGVSFCTCQALRWGFWGTDLQLANGNRLRAHLGSWVAGDVPSASEIAGQTGVAQYTGHLVGSVVDGTGSAAKSYLAVGGLTVNYDFSTQSGTVTVNNFDNVNYTGNISKLSTGQEHRISGTINSSAGPTRTGTMNGAFFRSGGLANGAMGGDVAITQGGGGYEAAATFAAHR